MKKSLKVIATATLAFSMFASVAMAAETTTTPTATTAAAAVKTSANFTDLANVDAALKAKIDALLAKGFMDGKSETSFDITGNMTRAEAAKLVAKIFNLTVGTETTSSFKDVDGTDASQAWAIPFIEAAKKAGIIDGMSDTTFAPKDNVTLGQLATLLVKGFKKGGDVKTTTPWYQGYLDVAKANGIDLGTDGAKAATRGDLVVGSFAADAAYQASIKPAKYAVAEVKAVGAKKLAVTLNGAVDTAVATFTVTRDGSTATFDAKAVTWDAAKTVATITLDSALIDATYAVTIGGVTVDDAKKTASVVAVKEKLAKIDIVTASETLPKFDEVIIDFKATNQYGETSSKNSSSFSLLAGDVVAASVSGKQQLKLNLNGKAKGDKIPVTVIDPETGVQANKIFTVGEAPIVSKIEILDLVDMDNKVIDSITAGKDARLKIAAYDQYGVKLAGSTFGLGVLNTSGTGITVVNTDTNLTIPAAGSSFVNDVDGTTELSLTAPTGASAKDITLTLISNGSGQSATKVIKVTAPKVPASVEFGDFTTALAVGDTNKYVPLVVKNAAGDVMTAQEIADAAGKFTVYAVGGIVNLNASPIATSGDNKGKIVIDSVANKGNGSIVIQLKDKPEVKASLSISAADSRYADRIAVSTKASDQLVSFAGVGSTTSNVQFKTFDQLNGDFNATNTLTGDSKVTFTLERVGGTGGTFPTFTGGSIAATTTPAVTAVPLSFAPVGTTGTFTADASVKAAFATDYTWTATSATTKGTYKVTATLYKKVNSTFVEVGNTSSQIEVVDGTSSSLVYTVALDKAATDNKIFALSESTDTTRGILGGGAGIKPLYDAYIAETDPTDKQTALDLLASSYTDYAKKAKVTAVDGSKTVSVPANVIESVYVTNPAIASVGIIGTDEYIVGKTEGTTAATVLFATATGKSSTSLNVTVVKAKPVANTIAFTKTSKYVAVADFNGQKVWVDAVAEGLKIVDQYASEYVSDSGDAVTETEKYATDLGGVVYFISDVKYDGVTGTKDTLAINASNGTITLTPATSHVKSFKVNAVSNGKTATIEISTN